MKLELAEFPVERLILGRRFGYRDKILETDEGALLDLVRQDPRLCDATLAIASPGDNTRITGYPGISSSREYAANSGAGHAGNRFPGFAHWRR
jgi:hypothetical protein